MQERHLRPDEFELLLDGEEGFGVAPLRAHLRGCAACGAELEEARRVMHALDSLPDFAPSRAFADSVMTQVHVFEPWHAAALDTIQQFVPATRGARVAAGVGAAVSAGVVTAIGTWALARADFAVFGLAQVGQRVSAASSDVANTLLGQPGLEAVRTVTPELVALMVGGFVAVSGATFVGLRALATASRRST